MWLMKLAIRPDELKKRRLQAVMTRRELAEAAGITSQRIDMLEAGIRKGIRPDTARKLAEVLGCSAQDITEVVTEEVAS